MGGGCRIIGRADLSKCRISEIILYIEDEYTREEQEIQRKIISRAKEEKQKGLKTKIGYRKLIVDGKKYIWNDTEKTLQIETENRQSKN